MADDASVIYIDAADSGPVTADNIATMNIKECEIKMKEVVKEYNKSSRLLGTVFGDLMSQQGTLLLKTLVDSHQADHPKEKGAKRKKMDNPDKKKREPSAYNVFMKGEITRIKEETDSNMTHKEVFAKASSNWGNSDQNPKNQPGHEAKTPAKKAQKKKETEAAPSPETEAAPSPAVEEAADESDEDDNSDDGNSDDGNSDDGNSDDGSSE